MFVYIYSIPYDLMVHAFHLFIYLSAVQLIPSSESLSESFYLVVLVVV